MLLCVQGTQQRVFMSWHGHFARRWAWLVTAHWRRRAGAVPQDWRPCWWRQQHGRASATCAQACFIMALLPLLPALPALPAAHTATARWDRGEIPARPVCCCLCEQADIRVVHHGEAGGRPDGCASRGRWRRPPACTHSTPLHSLLAGQLLHCAHSVLTVPGAAARARARPHAPLRLLPGRSAAAHAAGAAAAAAG